MIAYVCRDITVSYVMHTFLFARNNTISLMNMNSLKQKAVEAGFVDSTNVFVNVIQTNCDPTTC